MDLSAQEAVGFTSRRKVRPLGSVRKALGTCTRRSVQGYRGKLGRMITKRPTVRPRIGLLSITLEIIKHRTFTGHSLKRFRKERYA